MTVLPFTTTGSPRLPVNVSPGLLESVPTASIITTVKAVPEGMLTVSVGGGAGAIFLGSAGAAEVGAAAGTRVAAEVAAGVDASAFAGCWVFGGGVSPDWPQPNSRIAASPALTPIRIKDLISSP